MPYVQILGGEGERFQRRHAFPHEVGVDVLIFKPM